MSKFSKCPVCEAETHLVWERLPFEHDPEWYEGSYRCENGHEFWERGHKVGNARIRKFWSPSCPLHGTRKVRKLIGMEKWRCTVHGCGRFFVVRARKIITTRQPTREEFERCAMYPVQGVANEL